MSVDRSDLSTLLSSASLVAAGTMFSVVAQLVERVVIGRVFSPAAYGEVNLGLAILGLSVTFAMVGFNHGVPRYMSRMEDERDVRGVWVTGIVVTLAIGLVAAAVLWLNVGTVAALLFDDAASTGLLRLFVLAIPFVVGLQLGISAIRGMENTLYKAYVNDLFYPGLRLVLLVVLLGLGVGLEAAGYAYLVAAAVAFVAAHVMFDRLFPLVGPFRTYVRELVTFSAPLIVATLLAMLLTRTDTLMIGFFRSSAEVGYYSAAYPVANGLIMVLSVFGYLYLPLTSRLDADGERDQVERIYAVTTKWIYVVTFPAFLLFVAFPGDVVAVLFGENYRVGGVALALLSVGFFTSAATGRNRETLSALGYTRQVMYADLLAFGTNLGLNLLAIPRYGFAGAAAVSAGSFVLRNLTLNAFLWREFAITPLSRYSIRTFVALPVVLLPPALVASQWLAVTAAVLPVVLVVAGLLALVVVSLVGGLEPADAVVVEFVEDLVGTRVSFLHEYIPEDDPR